jgi:hypothetical protein
LAAAELLVQDCDWRILIRVYVKMRKIFILSAALRATEPSSTKFI